MNRNTKLIIGIAAIGVAGAVAAGTILCPQTHSTPIKASPGASSEFDHSHKQLDELLRANVKAERVNYKALKADPSKLNSYLGQLAAVSETKFKTWDEEQQLAMLINLYNAATLKLIIDHYPVKGIKDIGGLFKQPWDIESLTLFGKTATLDHLEHEILRKNYGEPRVHFAIVCAAKSCPALRPSAYTPENLDAQLREQGEKFLRDRTKNRIDAGKKTIYLSKVFKWFDEDFEEAGTVIDFVKPYFGASESKPLNNDFKIRYTSYDWSLNEQ